LIMATGAIIPADVNYGKLVGNGVIPANTPRVTDGGVITKISENGLNYIVHTFTSSGNFVINDFLTTLEVEYLVVAGGGGGAYNNQSGIGGPGGGFVIGSVLLSPAEYVITIGAGGEGKTKPSYGGGTSGSNSVAFQQTAGGGIVTGLNTSVSGTPQSRISSGGGGAGAGGPGISPNGGPGLSSSINGIEYFYGAGGGRGLGGLGGISGGGNGAVSGVPGEHGAPNSGGGGGGGAHAVSQSAGNGGSGIVIIRYRI
jgi:hypothetical protein